MAQKFDVKTECKGPFMKQGCQHENNIKICDKNWICGRVVVSSGLEYDPVTELCEIGYKYLSSMNV